MPADGNKHPIAVLNALQPLSNLGIARFPGNTIFRSKDRTAVTDGDKETISISYASEPLIRSRILIEPVHAISRDHNDAFVTHGYKNSMAIRDRMNGTRSAGIPNCPGFPVFGNHDGPAKTNRHKVVSAVGQTVERNLCLR